MIETSHAWTSELIGLLDQQRGLYTQLHQLSHEQRQIIRSEQPEISDLVVLLGHRQNLIDQLTRLGRQIDPYRRDWPKLWRSLDGPARSRISRLIEDVQALIDVILERDEKDRAALLNRRGDAETE